MFSFYQYWQCWPRWVQYNEPKFEYYIVIPNAAGKGQHPGIYILLFLPISCEPELFSSSHILQWRVETAEKLTTPMTSTNSTASCSLLCSNDYRVRDCWIFVYEFCSQFSSNFAEGFQSVRSRSRLMWLNNSDSASSSGYSLAPTCWRYRRANWKT